MFRLAASRRPGTKEPLLLAAPRRDAIVAAMAALVTLVVFVAMANSSALAEIQRLDNFWLRLMVWGRLGPVTLIAKTFNILGLVYVTAPVRIAIAGYLGLRRQWWHLASFAGAVILSEILIGPLKAAYDRPRPLGSLVATTGASFPSGHAIAASVTALAAVIALVPSGNRRIGWGLAAAAFALIMALSRAYLGAHWLSDALAGLLLGTSCAMLVASATDLAQRMLRRAEHEGPSLPAAKVTFAPAAPEDHG
jgi:membrane-associated phospholipid phosphatase